MDGVLSFWPHLGLCTKHGAKTYSNWMSNVKQVLETMILEFGFCEPIAD
jgi:hypothetical protein